MRIEINAHQRFKAIYREMDKSEAAFAEKPEVLAAKTSFGANNNKIGEHLSQLMRPVSTVRGPKQDSENRMRKTLSQMIGIGLALATSQDNQPLISTFRNYEQLWRRCSAYQLYETSLHTYDELIKFQELAAGNGLTEEKLSAFQQKIQDYGETLDSTGFQLSDRRKSRKELKELISANHHILRMQLDKFVRFVEEDYPELFRNYMFLRKRKSSKSKPDSTTGEPAEITGTVTNSATGLPVPNATINIIDYNLIALTDIDGCYVIEDLEPGTYLIHCYAGNFQVPDAVTITAESNDSLVVDFSLLPVPVEPVPAG
jgi:hypothetical protein